MVESTLRIYGFIVNFVSARTNKRHHHRTFPKVYMELRSYFLFLQEQIKDIIIIRGASAEGWKGIRRSEKVEVPRKALITGGSKVERDL